MTPHCGSPVRTLAYFFMLPNACFPLFPVVDSSTFRRNYFDDDAYAIYQRGIDWMVRGVIHLLLYRYVYYNLALGAVGGAPDRADLIQYIVANFLLYLRVSGLFHLVVGHAVPVWLPIAGDAPQVPACGELHAISGAGSTSTGRTSCRRSSTIRRYSG